MKKRNDQSKEYSDWSTKKLKNEATELYNLIYGENPCYGSHDIQNYDRIADELWKRGINSKITFYHLISKQIIPKKGQIETYSNNIVKIRIPHTEFYVLGERQPDTLLWNAYIIDDPCTRKELIREGATTESFARFSGIILKTPFPYEFIQKMQNLLNNYIQTIIQ